jgi:hypothetical protein
VTAGNVARKSWRAVFTGRMARRVRRVLERAVGLFPLTPLGFAVLLGSGMAYAFFAAPRVDYVIQLVCLLCAALTALAVGAVVPGAWVLHRALKRGTWAKDAQVMEARQGFVSLLRLPVLKGLPLLEVGWRWRRPSGFDVAIHRDGDHLVERAACNRRRLADQVERAVVLEDAFGLARITLHRTFAQRVTVLPWAGNLLLSSITRALSQGEDLPHPAGAPVGDRADMRRYAPGDPLRMVLWKIYARTGEMMVRLPEHAISPQLRVAAYLPAVDGDEPAAAAARVALAGGLLGDRWTFGADGTLLPTSQVEDALGMVAKSGGLHNSVRGNAAGLHAFCQHARAAGQRQLLLFLPGDLGDALDRVVAAVRAWNGPTVVVLVTDGVTSPAQSRAWLTLLKTPQPTTSQGLAPCPWEHIQHTTAVLARLGAQVTALDRLTGRVLAASTRSQQRAA